MKVTISDFHIRMREVELPDHCPGCGVQVPAPDSLVKSKLMYLITTGEGDKGESDFFVEGAEPTFYACTHCGEVLVSGFERISKGRARAPLGIGSSFGKLTFCQRREQQAHEG